MMGGISGISSFAQAWPAQSASSINASTRSDRDGDNDGSRVSGPSGRHQGGGAFMQDVMQSLQSLGLNLSGSSSSSVTSPATGAPQGVSTSSNNVGQALHTFLHDLHQALRQSGGAQQPSSTIDRDGDNDNARSPSNGQNGYSNFATRLQDLMGSLNNTSGTPATHSTDATLQTDFSNLVSATGGSSSSSSTPTLQNFLSTLESNVAGTTGVSGTTGAHAGKLQTDFANLLNALGGGSSSSSSSTPTLQDFLNKMISNASNPSPGQSGVGSILSVQA
jgi:hypothetical protein